jgi:PEP-CTERM motif
MFVHKFVFIQGKRIVMNGKALRFLSIAAIAMAPGFLAAGPARASVVWSEDWNPTNFATSGTVTDGPVGDLTDRSGWLDASYNVFTSGAPADEHGWTFTGSDFLVVNTTSGSPDLGSGALYLNECCNTGATGGGGATASTTITGLTAGKTYHLDFSYWGDNRPDDGAPTYPSFPGFYDLFLTLGGASPITYAGVDQFPGSSAPYDVDLIFTATGPTETLAFSQFSSGGSQQSPILGDLAVSTPEPSTWVMLGLGFAALGYAQFRRAGRSVACRAA